MVRRPECLRPARFFPRYLTLENAREILREEAIPPLCNPTLPKARFSWITHASLSCEVDPVAHIRFGARRLRHKVLLTHIKRADTPLLPEQGPYLISGAVTTDDATFTTFLSLARGTSAKSRFNYRALLDTGSSQSVIRYGCTPSLMRQHNRMPSPA